VLAVIVMQNPKVRTLTTLQEVGCGDRLTENPMWEATGRKRGQKGINQKNAARRRGLKRRV